MQVKKINFGKVGALSTRDIAYQNEPKNFENFLSYPQELTYFNSVIADRKKYPCDRSLLVTVLNDQYQAIIPSHLQQDHITSLSDENTFTVITAHQPSLFTGPLFFVYKIFSTINLARQLSASSTTTKVIPIYIMGAEDHDFEEINHLTLFNKKIEWQNKLQGPIGKYTTEGMAEVIEEIGKVLGKDGYASELKSLMENCMHSAKNYADLMFRFVNHLFGSYGLLVVNMDDTRLKQKFAPSIVEEILNKPSVGYINETQEAIKTQLGFDSQAHARDINLFYLTEGSRDRIIEQDGVYKVLNKNLSFTKDEIILEITHNAEKFSPNVVMRPLYQETIFPNLAYVGGGGELAYWMERKSQFAHFNVFFPMLVRRNSVLIIPKAISLTMEKLNLDPIKIFEEEHLIVKHYLETQSGITLNTEEEVALSDKIFELLRAKAVVADKSLEAAIEAEKVKFLKQIEQIEGRIKKSLKQKEDNSVSQITNIKSKLFPNNGLQERVVNFMQFYSTMGKQFFDILEQNLNPLDKDFVVLIED